MDRSGRGAQETRAFIRALPEGDVAGQVRYLVRNVRQLVQALLVIWRLPRLTAELSDTPEATLLRRHLGRRLFGAVPVGRLGNAVLPVPADPSSYLRGHSRQALRTNVRRAAAMGVTVRTAPPGSTVLRLHDEAGRLTADQQATHQDLRACSVWLDACCKESVIAQTVVAVDGEWALLVWAMSDPEHGDAAASGRFLLHAELVRELSARGVRYLADNTQPWRNPSGLVYYQGLLGFDIASVSISSRRP